MSHHPPLPLVIISINIVVVLFGVGTAASAPEAYWNSVLPDTPIPNAIRDFLLPGGTIWPSTYRYTAYTSNTEGQKNAQAAGGTIWPSGYRYTSNTEDVKNVQAAVGRTIWPSGYRYTSNTKGEENAQAAGRTIWPSGYRYTSNTEGEEDAQAAGGTIWPSGYRYTSNTEGEEDAQAVGRTIWPSGYRYTSNTEGEEDAQAAGRTIWPSGYRYTSNTEGEEDAQAAGGTIWPSGYRYTSNTEGEENAQAAGRTIWPSGYRYTSNPESKKDAQAVGRTIWPSGYRYTTNIEDKKTKKIDKDVTGTIWPSGYRYSTNTNIESEKTDKTASGIIWPSQYRYTKNKNMHKGEPIDGRTIWPTGYRYTNGEITNKDTSGTILPSPYRYTKIQHEDDLLARFFLEKDLLLPGANITKHFMRFFSNMELLPRGAANSIPFSIANLPKILARFGIDPESVEAQKMKETLEDCFSPSIKGEIKTCATSLESMVDFVRATLATNELSALSTVVSKEGSPLQQYNVQSLRKLAESEAIICHPMLYPYLVYKCHTGGGLVRAYMAAMVGNDDKTTAEAVVVCHTDTSSWDPELQAFRTLKVKPGTLPICHVVPQEHLLWIPKEQSFAVSV